MKEKIIEKQDQIIANLKEVGQLYFKIKDKATQQDVARMDSLTTKGRALEAELIALKAQDTPLPPAEGAEEILDGMDLGEPIQTGEFYYRSEVLKAMTEYATLHAQRIAEKMVEERLREELMAYDKFLSNTYWGVSHLVKRDEAVDEYLKSRER